MGNGIRLYYSLIYAELNIVVIFYNPISLYKNIDRSIVVMRDTR